MQLSKLLLLSSSICELARASTTTASTALFLPEDVLGVHDINGASVLAENGCSTTHVIKLNTQGIKDIPLTVTQGPAEYIYRASYSNNKQQYRLTASCSIFGEQNSLSASCDGTRSYELTTKSKKHQSNVKPITFHGAVASTLASDRVTAGVRAVTETVPAATANALPSCTVSNPLANIKPTATANSSPSMFGNGNVFMVALVSTLVAVTVLIM